MNDEDKPRLPCHPEACKVCHGTDWDESFDVPCSDKSWCQAYERTPANGWHVCSEVVDHPGVHYFEAITARDFVKKWYEGVIKIDRDEQGLFVMVALDGSLTESFPESINGVRIRVV